jgi:hypothetical protein
MENNKRRFGDDLVLPFLLGDDTSEQARTKALVWVYRNYAVTAYEAFLQFGCGLLWGPLLLDRDEKRISRDEVEVR